MPIVDTGEIRLNYLEWGHGEITVLFIHGNLACANWFRLAASYLPQGVRVIAFDWRGSGGSEKPPPAPDYANYRIAQHAEDILAALPRLGIEHCHLATHSAGGLISMHMLLAEPQRFGKVLGLCPVGARGLRFPPETMALFQSMKVAREKTRKALALTATTLFRPETLAPGRQPVFAEAATGEQREHFEELVDVAFAVSDGVRFGTPFHLNQAWETGGLRDRQNRIDHEHLVLWGTLDPFIPREDLEEMAARMPNCRLIVIPDVGHSLLIERPQMYAEFFVRMFAPDRPAG